MKRPLFLFSTTADVKEEPSRHWAGRALRRAGNSADLYRTDIGEKDAGNAILFGARSSLYKTYGFLHNYRHFSINV